MRTGHSLRLFCLLPKPGTGNKSLAVLGSKGTRMKIWTYKKKKQI